MKITLVVIFALHSLIHLFGFLKAFEWYEFKELTQPISRTMGVLWLGAALLIAATSVLYSLQHHYWWLLAGLAVLLSQMVMLTAWQDAKYGTIINVLLLLLAFFSFQAWQMQRSYQQDVAAGIARTHSLPTELITEEDLQPLPEPVQRYLRYVGVVGKPKVRSIKVDFKVKMRGKGQDWFDMTAEQHSFFDTPERLFFLKAKVKGLPAQGYHRYKGQQASMDIKLFSTLPVAQAAGPEMFQSETVTFFNDMCILAPATLIDERISWEAVDDTTAYARFTNQGTTISATLYFNKAGQLINFSSEDRYDINAMEKYRFTTPLQDYQEINGYRLARYGEAVWDYPEGAFVYGKFWMGEVVYDLE
jgi:hypothetical protein